MNQGKVAQCTFLWNGNTLTLLFPRQHNENDLVKEWIQSAGVASAARRHKRCGQERPQNTADVTSLIKKSSNSSCPGCLEQAATPGENGCHLIVPLASFMRVPSIIRVQPNVIVHSGGPGHSTPCLRYNKYVKDQTYRLIFAGRQLHEQPPSSTS